MSKRKPRLDHYQEPDLQQMALDRGASILALVREYKGSHQPAVLAFPKKEGWDMSVVRETELRRRMPSLTKLYPHLEDGAVVVAFALRNKGAVFMILYDPEKADLADFADLCEPDARRFIQGQAQKSGALVTLQSYGGYTVLPLPEPYMLQTLKLPADHVPPGKALMLVSAAGRNRMFLFDLEKPELPPVR